MPSVVGNFFIKTIVNSPLHGLLGDSFAVITVEGRKTGRKFSTPINVKRQGDAWILVSMRERTWWRNLRNNRPALLHVGGKRLIVHGEIVEDHAAVAVGLSDYFRHYPAYSKYFGIQLGPDGKLDPVDLERAASEQILVRLCLS